MDTLRSAAAKYTGGELVSSTLCDDETRIEILVDPNDGYTQVNMAEGTVAAGYPEVNEDGDYVLFGKSNTWGDLVFTAAEGDKADEAWTMVDFTDKADVAPVRWGFSSDGTMLAIPRCCMCFSLGNGNLGTCPSTWCRIADKICHSNGSIPDAWCEWR